MIIFLDDLISEKEAKHTIKNITKFNYSDKVSYLMNYHDYFLDSSFRAKFTLIPMICIYERFLRSSKSINDFLDEEQHQIIATMSILDICAITYYETVCEIFQDPFLFILLHSIYDFEKKT